MGKVVVYYRVSTDKQEASGLGIEAQRAAFREYVKRTGDDVIGRYTETESGKRSDRPQLARALAHARRSRAKLVVAKLDRLARNLAFLDQLQRAKVHFTALDCEFANKMCLQMMMVMAEHECDQVSVRTKVALAALRERGVPLGAQRPECRNLTPASAAAGRIAGAAANRVQAVEAYADLVPDMAAERAAGASYEAIAGRLNRDGQSTRTGSPWSGSAVWRVLSRVGS
jgi:DNA invertase Pin-like site-specific DNA recombinase